MKKIYAFIFAALLAVGGMSLTSCGKKSNQSSHANGAVTQQERNVDARSIVGTWSGVVEGDQMIFTFNSDGRCTVDNSEVIVNGTYGIDGNTIYIVIPGVANTKCTISTPSSNKLIMDGVEYTRQ